MPTLKQPAFLVPGDEVMIISPSFCIDEDKLASAAGLLSSWGFRVRIGKSAARRYGPFAGTDEERLADFAEATADPSVKAVICSRGGYGLLRIIDKIDFSPLRKNPKLYVGFSDITVLHMWLSMKLGLISIHGEMPLNYYDPEKTPETISSLRKALTGELNEIIWNGSFYGKRDIKGILTGGNLSLVYSLIGTPAEPETKGRILFLEDVGEYFYHIDRMLMSLKLAGKLKGLSALVFGGMNDIRHTRVQWPKTLEETILEIVSEYDYPVLFDFPAGHTNDNRAMYIGRKVEINFDGREAVLSYR